MLPVWSRSASSAAVLPVASSVGESLISASGDIGRVSAISLSSVAVASMGHCAAISLTCPLVARTSQPAAGPAAAVVLSGDITVAGDRSKSGSAVAGAVGHLLRSAMSWWPIISSSPGAHISTSSGDKLIERSNPAGCADSFQCAVRHCI